MAALGLTMSAVSGYAASTTFLDGLGMAYSLSGTEYVPVDTSPLILNSGGGNQHQGNIDPVFSFLGDYPRLTIQRVNIGGVQSYLVIYPGLVVKNQSPPANATVLVGSTTALSNPADFILELGSLQTLLSTNMTEPWTIAVVEVDKNQHTKIDGSLQLNFPYAKSGGNAINVTAQIGYMIN